MLRGSVQIRATASDQTTWVASRIAHSRFALITKYGADASYQIAQVHAYRGESNKSFEWLERAQKQRDAGSGFAILTLAIACVGLYGTVSYKVARRTGEIGIRMALGAQRGLVVRMVLREVFVLAAVGLTIGLVASLAASKFVESFLYGIKSNDPLALLGAVAILLVAVTLGVYAPARRACRIDPMVALRHE